MSVKIEYESVIECESVTVKVPKQVMAFLRFRAGERDEKVEETIERYLLDSVRSLLECCSGEELIPYLGLDRVFYDLLADKRYKPKISAQKTE